MVKYGWFFLSYLSFFPHPIWFLHNKHIKPGLTEELNLISPLASDQNNYVIPLGWCWHFESPHTCGINGTKCKWDSLVTASNWAYWLPSPTEHSSSAYCVLWLAGGAAWLLQTGGAGRLWSYVAADLPDPGIKAGSPALQVDSLPTELSGKPWVESYHKNEYTEDKKKKRI